MIPAYCLHREALAVGHQERGSLPPPPSPMWCYILGAHDKLTITHNVVIDTRV